MQGNAVDRATARARVTWSARGLRLLHRAGRGWSGRASGDRVRHLHGRRARRVAVAHDQSETDGRAVALLESAPLSDSLAEQESGPRRDLRDERRIRGSERRGGRARGDDTRARGTPSRGCGRALERRRVDGLSPVDRARRSSSPPRWNVRRRLRGRQIPAYSVRLVGLGPTSTAREQLHDRAPCVREDALLALEPEIDLHAMPPLVDVLPRDATVGEVRVPNEDPFAVAVADTSNTYGDYTMRGKVAVVGVGTTQQGEIPGRSADEIAVDAIRLALADAGIDKSKVDGLFTGPDRLRHESAKRAAHLRPPTGGRRAVRVSARGRHGRPCVPPAPIPVWQHGGAARHGHFSALLRRLASRDSAPRQQVVYTTHSPLFVGIDRFDSIRLLRREVDGPDRPRVTKVTKQTADEAIKVLQDAAGGTGFTGATFLARLTPLMTPWVNEGFFGDVVVLVEGEEDRAWILGTATSLGHDFPSLGISVIPCYGKSNLDRPYVVFSGLTIPTYVVWDGDNGDKDAKEGENRRLLRLVGATDEPWPSLRVTASHTVFECTLSETVRKEVGLEAHDAAVTAVIEECGMSTKKDAFKSPVVVETVVRRLREQGLRSATLDALVDAVIAMRGPH